jgi:hypothetical protein
MGIRRPVCHRRACVAANFYRPSLSRNECARRVRERIAMREDRCPQLSVPIDAELKARLEAAAAREDRPVASFVRRIVRVVMPLPRAHHRAPTRAAPLPRRTARATLSRTPFRHLIQFQLNNPFRQPGLRLKM